MRVHPFYPSPHTTFDGKRICDLCGMSESARVHELEPVPAEVKRVEARIVGESE